MYEVRAKSQKIETIPKQARQLILEFHPSRTVHIKEKDHEPLPPPRIGFFCHRAEAESALSRLVERGVPSDRLWIFDNTSAPPVLGSRADSNEVLTNVLVDGAIGTAVGVGIGALGEIALVAANVSPFIASPLIAPLAMMGWGASIGGIIGAASGASAAAGKKECQLADLIRDAISSGQFVLVAETRTEQETTIAREVIQALVGEYKDISTA